MLVWSVRASIGCWNLMANILGICDPRGCPLPLSGYNIFRPFSYSSPKQDSVLWGSSLLTGALEEDTCSKTGESASWCCLICNHIGGQGFEVSPSISLVQTIHKTFHMREALLRNGGREQEEEMCLRRLRLVWGKT
ncbi:PREDICTED: uncharacterized protein LOC109127720 [Camelina sativa]|uniref:Uncharacterized protein LOC109127720 n=1 Tax=Camelina sativa TaxID=90675 RepID=A0ABM1QPF3_CAMSA|nr:PREDICTED: uncharacterized protein LOC109127720 [Camelina sativa]